ncbi:hypothetical protein LSAT2_011938 [Lamellibrachia satsuma]|nr:hypothetical protein LSAT2_011938 [Lamellibrachia satsuma]
MDSTTAAPPSEPRKSRRRRRKVKHKNQATSDAQKPPRTRTLPPKELLPPSKHMFRPQAPSSSKVYKTHSDTSLVNNFSRLALNGSISAGSRIQRSGACQGKVSN